MADRGAPEGLDALRIELDKQAKQQTAKLLIGGIIFLIGIAATGWWFYLRPKIDAYITEAADGLPSGAIVAFASSESEPCPSDKWEIYDDGKGRFIIGAGHNRGSELTLRLPGDVGGEEAHTLTELEMPTHKHSAGTLTVSEDNPYMHTNNEFGVNLFRGSSHKGVPHINPEAGHSFRTHAHNIGGEVAEAGRGQPHNNMPPFIALYFCKKK